VAEKPATPTTATETIISTDEAATRGEGIGSVPLIPTDGFIENSAEYSQEKDLFFLESSSEAMNERYRITVLDETGKQLEVRIVFKNKCVVRNFSY
jgi:hypothetical protein